MTSPYLYLESERRKYAHEWGILHASITNDPEIAVAALSCGRVRMKGSFKERHEAKQRPTELMPED